VAEEDHRAVLQGDAQVTRPEYLVGDWWVCSSQPEEPPLMIVQVLYDEVITLTYRNAKPWVNRCPLNLYGYAINGSFLYDMKLQTFQEVFELINATVRMQYGQ
jgi:hypothetical protein